MPKPMQRLSAYGTPTPDGGMQFDLLGMMIDVVSLAKMGYAPRAEFLKKMGELYDEISVEADYSGVKEH